MTKKKITEKKEETGSVAVEKKEEKSINENIPKTGASSKAKFSSGILFVQSTFNNTLMTITDKNGNALFSSSSGTLGFKGAKKGTPFASAKVAELLADKALNIGMKALDVVVKGVGAGRESAIRAVASKGLEVLVIRDVTPVPHNGPKPKKPRRV